MALVFIEPEPRGRAEGSPISHYVLEYAHGERVTERQYRTQGQAITDALNAEHTPLVSLVRNTDKGNPDHWRSWP
jgi:hypothetical protein